MLGDLGKLIVAKGFIKLPKVQKLPDLVTLDRMSDRSIYSISLVIPDFSQASNPGPLACDALLLPRERIHPFKLAVVRIQLNEC